ncbi:hypothetical protein PIB30_019101 [Stylosanthes scabra]|uniref:Uncharacterized protein n=1 Tax=Stylosanthes scabra TaxID=79078 RepID=A0ABU6V888_9FABA|nr:hypothetical protein [Stylosanthes scabra]
MGKKKSCQEVIVPRPLDATETRLYGWVEEAVLTQQSVVQNDTLSEFRRSYPLMEDSGAEGDYVLEAAGPSDRVPFRADEDGPHFLWVGVETALVAKIKAGKELSAALNQIEVLKGERDSALSFLPFKEKATTLEDELSEKKLEHQSALDRIAQLEAEQKVLKAHFESSQLSLEAERKRAVAAEDQVVSLAVSLKACQADLSKATEASEYWRSEWHTLGSESRWDPKGRRIFVPQESEVDVEVPSGEEVVPEQGLATAAQPSQPVAGDAAGEVAGASGECPT